MTQIWRYLLNFYFSWKGSLYTFSFTQDGQYKIQFHLLIMGKKVWHSVKSVLPSLTDHLIAKCTAGMRLKEFFFYLMIHSTHFIFLYGISHIVNDYPYNERGNLLLPLGGLLFPFSKTESFICIIYAETDPVTDPLVWLSFLIKRTFN